MIAYLLQGMVLGFAAGISPGPMLGLVITQTLRRGRRAGNIVALAPLVTDAPIILLIVVVLRTLPPVQHLLALVGGLFLVYLGIDTVRGVQGAVVIDAPARPGRVLLTAVSTNVLNPHPYLFWAAVGGPLLVRGAATGGLALAIAFLAAFYALLVGAKLAIAYLINRGRGWLTGRAYRLLLAGSGVLLVGLGVLLVGQGVQQSL